MGENLKEKEEIKEGKLIEGEFAEFEYIQNRFKSPVLWITVLAQVLSILMMMGVIDSGQSEIIHNIAIVILEIMVAFGILNNPTSKNTL